MRRPDGANAASLIIEEKWRARRDSLRRSEEYKRLKLLQDVDAIADDCRDLAAGHGLDADTTRKVIKSMLDDQPVALNARH